MGVTPFHPFKQSEAPLDAYCIELSNSCSLSSIRDASSSLNTDAPQERHPWQLLSQPHKLTLGLTCRRVHAASFLALPPERERERNTREWLKILRRATFINGGASWGVQIKGWHHTISGICLSYMEIIMFKPQSCVHSIINILLTFSQDALKSSASGRRRAICKDSRWLAINSGLSPGASNSKG